VHNDQARSPPGALSEKFSRPLIPQAKIGNDRGKHDAVSEFYSLYAQRIKEIRHMDPQKL
jgi:hypothetical protein